MPWKENNNGDGPWGADQKPPDNSKKNMVLT